MHQQWTLSLQLVFLILFALPTKGVCQIADSEMEDAFEALKDVYFHNDNTGWAVGRYSLIIHTSDGGKTWQVQHHSKSNDERVFLSTAFVDPLRGIAVGSDSLVLVTDDGGENWRPMSLFSSPTYFNLMGRLEQMRAANRALEETARDKCIEKAKAAKTETSVDKDNQEGDTDPRDALPAEEVTSCVEAAMHDHHTQMETLDAQLSKTPKFVPLSSLPAINFHVIQFADNTSAYLLSDWALFRSVDFGRKWTLVKAEDVQKLNNFFFLNATTGWIVGDGGMVSRTTDRGITWKEVSLDEQWALTSVFFLNEKTGFVGGDAGVLFATNDGGETWQRVKTKAEQPVTDMYWSSSRRGVIIASETAFLTEDRGKTWQNIELPVNAPERRAHQATLPSPLALHFTSPDTGYLVGTWGLVLKTQDGGKSVRQLRSEAKYRQKMIERRRSIKFSKFGFGVDFGHVQPVGDIRSRFGPGITLGMDFLGLKGRVKLGGGYTIGITSTREDIIAPVGELDNDVPVELKTWGITVNLSLLAQVSLFERGPLSIRAILGGGFVYHGITVVGENADKIESEGYGRDRVGFGFTQSLIVAYMFANVKRGDPTKVTRNGWHIKLGVQESRTWNTAGVQTDLGDKDDTGFGVEIWPMIALGFTIYL